ncbi:hypothetical protein ACFL18_01835 [Patescibacteria group bacterium]
MPASLTFFKADKVIQVDIIETAVTVQDLVNQIRDYEDELDALDYPKMCDAYGKQDLGGGTLVGITLVLLDDWRIQFEARPGDEYISVSVSGGNLVATNIYDDNPIKPSAFTQVSVTSSSSATLQELTSIQYSSFAGGVTIDTTNGTAGTAFPIGTGESPVNNLADAKAIAITRGFDKFFIVGDITIGATDNIDTYTLIGQSPAKTTITLTAGASTVNTEFENASVTGTLSGPTSFYGTHLTGIVDLGSAIGETNIHNSLLTAGTITMNSTAASAINVIDCWSGVTGAATPIFDVNGAASGISLRNYSGGIELRNISDGQDSSVDFASGKLVLAATNTSGAIQVTGVVDVEDSSGVGFTVNTDGVVAGLESGAIADAVWDETISDHVSTSSTGKTLKDAKTKATLASLK